MTVRKLTFALLLTFFGLGLAAQDAGSTYRSFTPADQWELGVDLGVPFIKGDIDEKIPGFGGGIHIRKALGHVFSIRVSGLYAKMKNENGSAATDLASETTWLSGSGQLVMTVNNLRFDKPYRKVGFNVYGGLGYANFEPTPKGATSAGSYSGANIEVGAGLAFRFNSKFNLGLEYTVAQVLGSDGQGDRLEGEDLNDSPDWLHWPHISLNFNIGGKDKAGNKKSEPLYWVNPMEQAGNAISELEKRPIYDPTDTDGDGIIDAIDDEDNSPAGARVDTKGVTLDSDGDKVPNYKDKEPFSPPGYTVNADGVAQVPKPITEADVNRIVDAKIAAIKFPTPQTNEWFLPMVNFGDNRYDLRYSEYEKLYQVATVLKNNAGLKVVAVGHTDDRGPEGYNAVLSYNRAKAAIEMLVSQYGVSRDRLILNWSGESANLVPQKGASQINRRVEFRIAKGETEMARPEGKEAGKGSFKGNKDAGY
ncbi:MAG: OmpA family protein [Phycisphaerae bacterium]|nr:OmpA family protein [Saprospiraceae bacterium]